MRILLVLAALMSLFATAASASDSLSHGSLPYGEQENAQKAADAFKAGHFDVAEAIYQAMAEDHPGSRFAWSNLGVARFQQGKLKEARDAFQHAVDLDPKDASSLAGLGITSYQLGMFQDAIDNLRVAVAINPDDASAHEFLGNACQKVGLKEEAKAEQKKAAELKDKELAPTKQPAPVVKDPKVEA